MQDKFLLGEIKLKYCNLEVEYHTIMLSSENFRKALVRIGELDPFDIKVTTFHYNHLSKKSNEAMNVKDYFKRGVLNVRYYLNRHKGKSGKYTNQMIECAARIEQDELTLKCKIKVPKKDYINIAVATYIILWQWDRAFCQNLLFLTAGDPIEQNRQIAVQTIAPIHTDIVCSCNSDDANVQKFLDYTRYIVRK